MDSKVGLLLSRADALKQKYFSRGHQDFTQASLKTIPLSFSKAHIKRIRAEVFLVTSEDKQMDLRFSGNILYKELGRS